MIIIKETICSAYCQGVSIVRISIFCCLFLSACSDGVLNSGADFGLPKTDNTDTGTEGGPQTDLDSDTTVNPCGFGIYQNGICWYLGAPNQSCTQTCWYQGGVAAQGGSVEKCKALLDSLLNRVQPYDYVQPIAAPTGQGLGCYLYNGYLYWITDLPFDPDQHTFNTQIACGCYGLQSPPT
jgi:hypothetical protein